MRHWSLWCVSALIFMFADFASAKEVVIVTSFPKELFETYKKTFEAKLEWVTKSFAATHVG